MATRSDTVVVLDGRVIPSDHPFVPADDALVARGDGVFETVLVRNGRACLVDAHLERLARSSAITGLPQPDLERWRSAVTIACSHWTEPGDAVLRMVAGRSTEFVTVSELPGRVVTSRRDGVTAMTLDRGVMAVGERAPWSISAAKSVSYAVNAAALRHAEGLGYGDVVLVSADGFVLEGPRSSVVVVGGDGVLATPPTTMPILPGTTVQAMFSVARAHGLTCEERALRVPDLLAAQGVWLLSSITLAARIHSLDGEALPLTQGMVDVAALVDEAVGGPS